jgi:hypothetical protein
MTKVRIHKVASELGVPSRELIQVAQGLGFPLKSHASTMDIEIAESLKAAIQGIAIATCASNLARTSSGHNPQAVLSGDLGNQAAETSIAPKTASTQTEQSQLGQIPRNPHQLRTIAPQSNANAPRHPNSHAKPSDPVPTPVDIGPTNANHNALMLVSMIRHDVSVSKNYEVGFNNMLKVVAALLSDLKQTVHTANKTLSWGELFFLRADRSTSVRGHIELEYGDESEIGISQRQKGQLGDIWWSLKWLNEDWTRPLQKLSQVVGLSRNPEADYLNQFISDLRSLEAQGLLIGIRDWEFNTGIPGRNIYISPKKEYRPKST